MAASPASSGSDEVSERGTIDISKEEVEALLKEKPKANKFNLKQKKGVHMMADSPATSDEGSHESGNNEFSNEEVEALLKEEPEAEEFNLKTKMEMKNHNKRLKLCIKWFQQVNENHNLDKVKLQSDLEAMHKKWFDADGYERHSGSYNEEEG
ncbi:hypothetical protein Dsin_031807 [Dipteronia sinensis]|uniref:Uncharacterized protein n=1 Tax=Dipteronia sinensis TaxID=43782 RepID=A0AAD9ZLR5_9ROSI|nr:hypothetical protein Dsin_031807 [Dipteronia sinensis]